MAGELGVDAGGEPVAHHQERRVGQGEAVAQELLQGIVQAAARFFVFPRKAIALKHVSKAALLTQQKGVLLKHVVAIQAGAGLRHAQQVAQIHKVRLRALALG